MKRKVWLILWVICMVLVLVIPEKVDAATTTKEVVEGRTYKVDLNGDGKKESLKFITKESGTRSTLKIYINGKRKYSYSYDNEHTGICQIGYIDLYRKDKYKELFVTYTTDNGLVIRLELFQYKNGVIKQIYAKNPQKDNQPLGLGDTIIAPSQRGDGTLTLIVDTPYDKGSLGYYYVEMLYRVKNGKLVKEKQSTYKVSNYWRKQKYTLTKKITFTTTPGGKKKAFTVKKGTVVYLNRLYCKSKKATAYIEMRTKQGKTGWMKVTNREFYKENYGWC